MLQLNAKQMQKNQAKLKNKLWQKICPKKQRMNGKATLFQKQLIILLNIAKILTE